VKQVIWAVATVLAGCGATAEGVETAARGALAEKAPPAPGRPRLREGGAHARYTAPTFVRDPFPLDFEDDGRAEVGFALEPGEQAWFVFSIDEKSDVAVMTAPAGRVCAGVATLTLFSIERGKPIAKALQPGDGRCARIDVEALPAGKYVVRAAHPNEATGETPPNRLVVYAAPHCDAACAAEPLVMRADGKAEVDLDLDRGESRHFMLWLKDAAGVALHVAGESGACGGDFFLELRRADDGELVFADEDGGRGRCPRGEPARDAALRDLPAGDYLLTVGAHPAEDLGARPGRLYVEVR
jgi:hypothetical protein